MPTKNQNLIDAALEVLKQNDRGFYTIPAESLYQHQWLWDSCFVAIGMRHYDIERAKIEILSLLRAQWQNGMLPHMIMTPGKREHPYLGVWQSWVNPNAPDEINTSGITQPPVLAEAIVQIGEKLPLVERRSWYRQVFPSLLAYHQWMYDERDPHNEGLILLIHPWETGMDNTPPWMAEMDEHLLPLWIRFLKFTRLEAILGLFRTDTRHVPRKQRPTNIEAMALYAAQRRLKRKEYNINRILNHSLFSIEDLGFNSILIRANRHLLEIAKTIKANVPDDLQEKMKLTVKAFDELWDPYTESYYTRDFTTHRLLKEPSIEGLLPLYSGCISKERAALLVKQLENEHMFGPPYPVPSAPLHSLWFDPVRYWQGPTWFNTNWLIIEGLKNYGYNDHADALAESMIELARDQGFHEYYNPLTGDGLGATNFSWTAALTIDLLKTNKSSR